MAERVDIRLTTDDLRQFYTRYFTYFSTLNASWQKIFIARCQHFTSEKIIIGAEGFEPNNEVKAIIAASAVQLTLGLRTWNLDYFDTIIIHPRDFDNKASGLKFKGETNLAGYIRLSWQSFISGYRITNDNVNLGLHEFTHALRFNPFRGFDQDYFIEHYFNGWLAAANKAYNDLRNKKETIFRKYGGANINEFLCVCIEHFFESPGEIKAHYPPLYYSTAILLNQYSHAATTELNVREKLFAEKNKIISFKKEYSIRTNVRKTISFKLMLVVLVPLLYTIVVAGITSGVTFLIALLFLFFYLRMDYSVVHCAIKGNRMLVTKGWIVFRKRRQADLQASQIISFRLYDNNGENAECDLVYYDLAGDAFYSENIPTGKGLEPGLLNELVASGVALFKSK